jgi:hypothetical protein
VSRDGGQCAKHIADPVKASTIESQIRDLPVISDQRVLSASLFGQNDPEQNAAKQQRPGTIIGTILD